MAIILLLCAPASNGRPSPPPDAAPAVTPGYNDVTVTTTQDQLEQIDAGDLKRLNDAHQGYKDLAAQIGRVIVGQQEIVEPLLAAVLAQGHVLIIGVPGLAKTLLVRTLAQVLGWSFKRIQFTPDMMPSDVIGMELLQEDRSVGGAVTRSMQFVRGPIFAHFILADEINRTPPKTQAALLEAMQEYTVTSMGKTYPLEKPFIVAATQNPIEQEGTYPLPEAQLDRFMLSLWMDYPSAEQEEQIVAMTGEADDPAVTAVFSKNELMAFQALVRRMPASHHVIRYAVTLVRATRPADATAGEFVRKYVEWGAGPRAGQHLMLVGRAMAVIEGEPAVTADHLRKAAMLVLRHRVLVNFNATGEGVDAGAVVRQVIEETAQPGYAS